MNKRSSKLTEIEKDILNKWFSLTNKSKKAYRLKEEFVKIMDKTTDIKKGKMLLESWIVKVEKLKTKKAISFVKTFRKRLEYIINYFHANTTNATLEGMINKVKSIKRRAFGVPNPYNMATRIFLGFQDKNCLYSRM